jgi:glycosyltransferase involved in cell wall biosynthesis
MKILLDLIPLKAGGGAQVGSSLVDEIEKARGCGHEWHALVSAESGMDRRLQKLNHIRTIARVPRSLHGRLAFERRYLARIVREVSPDVVYSQFGPGLAVKGVTRIVGSAYGNLYYPEIDFWRNWPMARRILYRIRDRFRLQRTLNADAWIFESDQIAERAKRLFGLPDDRVAVVRPSPSGLVGPSKSHEATAALCAQLPVGYRVLLLSGWHPNKGIDILPEVARCLREDFGLSDVRFVMSMNAEHPDGRKFMARMKQLGVSNSFVFTGSVAPEACVELYRACDCVLLLSLLESFSNNIVEAWAMNKPLLITDAEWSRALCGRGALYVERRNPTSIAAAIAQLRADSALRARLCGSGQVQLQSHPTPSRKVEQYVHFIERFAALGPRN